MISSGEFWQSRRVFITGCTGFVGSWLTAALVDLGAEVIGLVRTVEPHSQLARTGRLDLIERVDGDLLDYDLLERTLRDYAVDTVFHLAGQTIVGTANLRPVETFETNIRGTWLMLEAARQSGSLRGIIVASSEKAYGEQAMLPYVEEQPLEGRHPYEVSKSCADLLTRSFAHTYGMATAVTRCSNLYGGGDLNWDRLLPGTIRSVLRGEQPRLRSDGTFKRDYLFAGDAVRGYLMLAEQLERPDVRGRAFNLGSGCPVSALEVVKTIIALSDYSDLEPIILDQVRHEIQDEYMNPHLAMRTLDWRPNYTLESGLKETMAWYRDYLAE